MIYDTHRCACTLADATACIYKFIHYMIYVYILTHTVTNNTHICVYTHICTYIYVCVYVNINIPIPIYIHYETGDGGKPT